MGIYSIECPGCKKLFQWFSGSADQFCEECKKPKGVSMNSENKEVEYLNQIIKLQQDMIDMLKAEIGRLKITTIQSPLQPITSPIIGPGYPVNPNPFIPGTPGNPFNPYIVTCGSPSDGGGTNPTESK